MTDDRRFLQITVGFYWGRPRRAGLSIMRTRIWKLPSEGLFGRPVSTASWSIYLHIPSTTSQGREDENEQGSRQRPWLWLGNLATNETLSMIEKYYVVDE